jgi:predicted glycosyltransferase
MMHAANHNLMPDADHPLRRIPGSQPRIALYSHDGDGLGHVRRNLLIARSLSRTGARPVILMLSGVHEAAAFSMPAGVDCLTLPSLGKDATGKYQTRSLGVPMRDLIDLRSRTIAAALQSFRPDVLIVDKVPLGAMQELAPLLQSRQAGSPMRLVLGLREVLDDADSVRREWRDGGYEAAVRQFYHRIWVYGDPKVFDPIAEYGFSPDIADRVRYTGYLDPFDAEAGIAAPKPHDLAMITGAAGDLSRVALCVVGGGRDGFPLAEAFLRADLPADTAGVLVTGPLMPLDERAALQRLAARSRRHAIHEFVTDPTPFMRRADRIIAMGGYNTMCEIASLGKPALIVPRVTPRTEQLIRAQRFARLGVSHVLHPDRLSPDALASWLSGSVSDLVPARSAFDFEGVRRLPALLDEAMTAALHDREACHAAG